MILTRKPRTAGGNMGGATNDFEALRDQNQRLKVALSGAIEENRRYQVNKTRLEAELLRADGRVETLLAELEQAPGRRCTILPYSLRAKMLSLYFASWSQP